MLSPIMTTIGNANRACHAASCSPMSYWPFSPVPLSPITANFSESGLLGSGTCADAGPPPCAADTATVLAELDDVGPAQQITPTRHTRNAVAGKRRGCITVRTLSI